MLTDAMEMHRCQPRLDLLTMRDANEAYLSCEVGRQYALYFPAGGEVTLDLSQTRGKLSARWLDIARSRWKTPTRLPAGRPARLAAPGTGDWAILITAASDPGDGKKSRSGDKGKK